MTAPGACDSDSRRASRPGSRAELLEAGTSRRNAQATRQRILEAAFVEFAAAGLAGARVDRIAAAAGCNKSLIFVYFESKAALFETLVRKELDRIDREVAFNASDPLPSAARLFDFAMGNPNSMRLLAWHGLEAEADGLSERSLSASSHRTGLKSSSPADHLAKSVPAGFLATAIIALCTAWSQANLVGPLLVPDEDGEPSDVRDAVLEGVQRLSEQGRPPAQDRSAQPPTAA